LVALLPQLSSSFGLKVTTDELATLLTSVGLPVVNNDCGKQAILIDVGTTLVTAESQASVSWAQTSILWQLVRSEDATSAFRLRDVINSADWAQAGVRAAGAAVVMEPRAQNRQVEFEGWLFDFDIQTVHPKNVSWLAEADPTPFQVSLAQESSNTLDCLYSFAKGERSPNSLLIPQPPRLKEPQLYQNTGLDHWHSP
jgi:hypothetical protein